MTHDARIAETYRGQVGSTADQRHVRDRIDWLVDQAQGRVLDVGCARGIAALLCARRGLDVVGIDAVAEHVEHARAEGLRKPPTVSERLDFRVADVTRLDIADGSFDAAIAADIIHELSDPGAALAELARVVVPDGIIALTTPFGYSPRDGEGSSFYPASLVQTLAPHVSIESADLVDGYFRVRAKPGEMGREESDAVILELQPSTEAALDGVYRDLSTERERRARLARRAESQRRRLVKRRHALRLAHWRLQAAEETRLRRLGRVFKRLARRPGRVRRFPRDVARALRALQPPEPPQEPAAKTRPERPVREWRTTVDAAPAGAYSASVDLPEAPALSEAPPVRPELTVATILAPFSALAFRYEWHQLDDFGPDDWREVFETTPPDLLFVESAFKGNHGRWHAAFSGRGQAARAFADLVQWCRSRGIPTVFWNKEDPPFFDHFIEGARLFDHVFTVDSDCVPKYCEILSHERVGVLPFAAQPRIHNPVSVPGGRMHDVAFAGSYLANVHPGRREQMEVVLAPALDFGLHIFSRIVGGDSSGFDWPAQYQAHLVGSLPYERLLAAYKAYKVVLNVNTVAKSPTMCARRVFEISATSTPVLSGDAAAIRAVFGDLIAIARTADEARDWLARLLGDSEEAARRGHEAMRHVLAGHTYSDRVDAVLEALGMSRHARSRPSEISAVIVPDSDAPPGQLLHQLASQTRAPAEVVVAPHEPLSDRRAWTEAAEAAGIATLLIAETTSSRNRGAGLAAAIDAATGDLLALTDERAQYGPHYLEDLAGALEYSDAAVAGKAAVGRELAGSDPAEHAYGLSLHPASLLAPTELFRTRGIESSSPTPERDLLTACERSGQRGYAADRYSFRPVA